MDEQQDDGGLLNIQVSDSEDDAAAEKKAKRTGQTEDEFQAVRKTYVAKVENGNIYQHIKLPVQSSASKLDIQELLHAVEELYFFRRYQEALDFIAQVLQGDASRHVLDNDSLQLLQKYAAKCKAKQDALNSHT